jgi:hypothetical protein
MRAWIAAHKVFSAAIGAVIVASGVFVVFYWFGFQNAVVDVKVNEAAPSVAPAAAVESPAAEGEDAQEPTRPQEPVTLANGRFRGLEHDTEGTALLIELPNGSQVIRFEGFDVLNGPDLKVYLSTAPADAAEDRFDDDYVSLGDLKGNVGDQNYDVPKDADAMDFDSVVIWCERFSVGFGVAPLERV